MRGTKETGITLIALIITIVVLLILAGVAINLTVGDNGIFRRAEESVEIYEKAQVKEEIELAINEGYMEKFYKETITKDKLADYLTEKLPGLIITEVTDDKIVGEYKGYEFEIDDKYNVTITGKASIKVTYTIEPQGYTKESVTITLSIELLEGGSIVSVTPQSSGVEVIEEKVKFKVTENGTYIFRIVDDKNNQKDIKIPIKNIDKEAPNVSIEPTEEKFRIKSTIKVKVTINDNQCGVDLANCKWVVNNSNTEIGTDVTSYTGGSITSQTQEIETESIATAGTYYIHVLATDKLGNVKETISSAITVENAYEISTPEDLQNMKNDLTATYYVVNDIDMSDFTFKTISGTFKGTLDGQGHTISNLEINGEANIGMFSYVGGGAEIKNILLKEVFINATSRRIAVFSGHSSNTNLSFKKVGITGKIHGGPESAVFISEVYGNSSTKVTFEDCYARVDFSGYTFDGGGFTYIRSTWNTPGVLSAERCYWTGTSSYTRYTNSFFVTRDYVDVSGVSVKNSYYDKEKFPISVNAKGSGTGLTTAQMQTQSSYVGWDFENTWYMGEDGYPELKFE